jgi:hypothetical protein
MLTRRDILNELRRIGIKEPSLLNEYFEDIKHYLEINYGLKFSPTREQLEEEVFKQDSALIK